MRNDRADTPALTQRPPSDIWPRMFKEFWPFVEECFHWAYSGSWKWRGWLTFGVGLVLAVAAVRYLNIYKGWPPLTKEWATILLAGAGLSVFLVRLAVAPYFLWRNLNRELRAIHDKKSTPPSEIEKLLTVIDDQLTYILDSTETDRDLLEQEGFHNNMSFAFHGVSAVPRPDPFPIETRTALAEKVIELGWPQLTKLQTSLATFSQALDSYAYKPNIEQWHVMLRYLVDAQNKVRGVRESPHLRKP